MHHFITFLIFQIPSDIQFISMVHVFVMDYQFPKRFNSKKLLLINVQRFKNRIIFACLSTISENYPNSLIEHYPSSQGNSSKFSTVYKQQNVCRRAVNTLIGLYSSIKAPDKKEIILASVK